VEVVCARWNGHRSAVRDDSVRWLREEDRWLFEVVTHLAHVVRIIASDAINPMNRKTLPTPGDFDAGNGRRDKYVFGQAGSLEAQALG
jgi:hypothetical protein